MTEIIEIEGKFEFGVLNAAGIGSTDLCPAAKARAHPMTFSVMRDMAL